MTTLDSIMNIFGIVTNDFNLAIASQVGIADVEVQEE